MKTRYIRTALTALLTSILLLIVATNAVAQDEKNAAATTNEPGKVAEMWVFWVKDGQSAEFEAAVKEHAAWRKTAGETFDWSIYQPVVGDDLSHYVIRSGDHHWKDFDVNNAWETKANAGKAFEEKTGKHVARMEHYFAETDTEHSNWIDSPDYKYFGVTEYNPKSGTYADRLDALNKIQKAVTDAKWPFAYEISNRIGGNEPMLIVTPFKSYADMANPDPSLMKVLSNSLKSDTAAGEIMKKFGGTIEDTSYTVYAYRPDLSTPK